MTPNPLINTSVPAAATPEWMWRVVSLVNVFRLLTPVVLIAIVFTLNPRVLGRTSPVMFVSVATLYLLFAIASASSLYRRWPRIEIQTVLQICIDIAAISLLTYASGGTGSGLATLLILPLGAGALVVRARLALLLAALGTIALLVQQGIGTFTTGGDFTDFASAGLIGTIIFSVTLAAGPLAKSLRESAALIQQREIDLANLAQLNEFIVQHLRESILVVDEKDRIRLINESAEQLLSGSTVAQNASLGDISPRLQYLLQVWRENKYEWQLSSISLASADGGALIQPHFVSLEARDHGPTLIFLEDTSLIAERVQQSKLAALGRLSASIAHEIRNPVGAMSHAAQLLHESTSITPQERRLAEIVRSNGERVSTIVDNVLQLSRRDKTRQERIALQQWVDAFLTEFRETQQVDASRIRTIAPVEEIEVGVDPSHLHQIMWNLCENAVKYGQKPGATAPVEVRIGRIVSSNRPFVEVADRGPGIPVADAERIFEPFFTAGTGGIGLGLFISRELAQTNRAVLLYEPRPGGGTIFRITFADPQRWGNI
jgi:two-component system sensor histidine kinase PilS (NtrC family)